MADFCSFLRTKSGKSGKSSLSLKSKGAEEESEADDLRKSQESQEPEAWGLDGVWRLVGKARNGLFLSSSLVDQRGFGFDF